MATRAASEMLQAQNDSDLSPKNAETGNDSDIVDQIQALKNEMAKYADNLTAANQQIQILKTELNKTNTVLSAANDQIKDLKKQTARNAADLTESDDQITALKKQTARNAADLTESDDQITALKKQTARNAADLTESDDQIKALKKKTARNAADLTESDDQIQILKTELNETNTVLSAANDLSPKNAETGNDSDLIVDQIEALKKEKAKYKEDLTAVNDKLIRAEDKIQRLLSASSDEVILKNCGVLQLPSHITDEKITASSWAGAWSPRHGRLFSSIGNGAWCPKTKKGGEWIQVDLGRIEKIHGIATQGCDHGEWVTSYKVSFKTDNGVSFCNVEDGSGPSVTFKGNTDKNTVVLNKLPNPINARYVRIYPLGYHGGVELRFDLITG